METLTQGSNPCLSASVKKSLFYRFFLMYGIMHFVQVSGYSVARLSRLVWDEEVASSNLATPTFC
nr:hypothetical protein [uncultured bacterium]